MEESFKKNVKEKLNLKFIYTWLSQIEEMNYVLYIRLLRVFQSVENLYNMSKEKNNFINILIQNNIILSKKLICNLTSFSLKEKSFKIYNNLIKQKIDIIHIEDSCFQKNKFFNMYNQPICLFVYGNINKLNEKVVYLHKEKFNEYGDKIYSMFSEYITNKNWNNVISLENSRNNNINFKDAFYNEKNKVKNKIYFFNEDIFAIDFKLENTKIKNIIKEMSNLYIFIPNKSVEMLNKNKLYILELIVSISDICIIPQAKYDKNMYVKSIVELFLEQGKNVLVAPGNIYCKFNYLSNYLIKEGAEIILNKNDIDKYI